MKKPGISDALRHRAVSHSLELDRQGKGLRVLLIAGRFRPKIEPDYAEQLLSKLVRSRHSIAGVITWPGDRIIPSVRRLQIAVFKLPAFLDRPRTVIRHALANSRRTRNLFRAWLSRMSHLDADIGVVFYGGWLPPGLAGLPRLGFVNFHPAPLPELRGVEPDTFAVLEGRRKMRGAVHLVSSKYDDGPIVAFTPRMRLTRWTTPPVVWHTLTELGIPTIVRALDKIANDDLQLTHQDRRRATDADRPRAHRESLIRWKSDDTGMICRRLLTYCGQDIRIRLKADIEGRRFCIRDLEVYRGQFPGKPGQRLGTYKGPGRYCGMPVVRALDGIVILITGAEARRNTTRPEEPAARIIPPRRRRHETILRRIEWNRIGGH